jgi:hypothetical protein
MVTMFSTNHPLRSRFTNTTRRLLAMTSLLTAGCAGGSTNSGAVAPPTSEPGVSAATLPAPATAESKPFMVHEADLPAGFPPPGPVEKVIVKTYPAARAATVLATDVKGKGQDRLFMPLFNHIQKNNISMTSPVVMDFPPADAAQPATPPIAMSFVYATTQTSQTGRDGIVSVHDMAPLTVLSVGVRGSYDAVRFNQGMKLINQYLAAHPGTFTIAGPPRFLGYNSPFVPWFMKFGEVQLPVREVASR